MAQVGNIRGLNQYIKKIRAAATQEEREEIVHKELAKIREKYSQPKKCSVYDLKKYTWKLLYSHMMGFEVDFGHKQAADLIPSKNFDEKQVGYQALTILLNENDTFMTLPVNNVLKDLTSGNELFMSLALSFAGAVAGPEMAAATEGPVRDILLNPAVSPYCRKKAALCMLRLYRKLPEDSGVIEVSAWHARLAGLLASATTPGVQLSVMGLILGVLERGAEGYEELWHPIVHNLSSVVRGVVVSKDYLYYGIPCPWLQCKFLRALLYLPTPADEASTGTLEHTLQLIITAPAPQARAKPNANLHNARTSIFVEAVHVALKLGSTSLVSQCLATLINSLSSKDANSRYVALDTMAKVAHLPDVASELRQHIYPLCHMLQDVDPGVRAGAIEVVTTICNAENVEGIVETLLQHIQLAGDTRRQELVVKVAHLTERFPPSIEWYINTILTLMDIGAPEVNDDVWYRAVHLITNTAAMRGATGASLLKRLQEGTYSVQLINTAGYVLSEFPSAVPEATPAQIASALLNRYDTSPPATQSLLLTALLKLRFAAPEDASLQERVESMFELESASLDQELQQRAVEYLALSRSAKATEIGEVVCAPMPAWPKRGDTFQDAVDGTEAASRENGADAAAANGAEGNGADSGGEPEEAAAPEAPPAAPVVVDLLDFGTPEPAAEGGAGAQQREAADPLGGVLRSADASQGSTGLAIAAPVIGSDSLANPFVAAGPRRDAVPQEPAPDPSPGTSPPNDAQAQASIATHISAQVSGTPSSVAPPASEPPAAGAPITRVDDQAAQMPRMLALGKGVLLEDTMLQIGVVTARASGAAVTMTLFCGNKSDTAHIEALSLSPQPHPVFRVAQLPVIALQPQQQVQLPLSALATGVNGLAARPTATISYRSGQQAPSYHVELPLCDARLLVPNTTVTQASFFSSWAKIAEHVPGGKAVELATLPAPLADGAMLAAHMSQLGYSAGSGAQIDPTSERNFAGSASIGNMEACVRVEVNPADTAQVSVTVVCENGDLAASLVRSVCDGLVYLSRTSS